MQKVMMVISLFLGFALTACQTTTTQNATSSEGVSVASGWEDSETGRKFRIGIGIGCKAWNHESPALTDELSKHFSSSQQQRNIKSLRREGANFGQLCREVLLVKTKKEARSWLAKGKSIAYKFIQLQNYWIRNPLRWSNAEEARIWYAFNCRRNIGKAAQVTARVIAENNPWNADSARKKGQSINAKASNICSRGYSGAEFVSENRDLFNSFLSLHRLRV